MMYGYARISRKTQNIERQVKNLQGYNEKIVIHQEAYTGTSIARPEWSKLQKKLKAGDTLVFDSVSRMSRNSKEGIKKYFHLLEKEIELVFLKEPHINTEVYQKAIEANKLDNTDNKVVNAVLEGVKKALDILARQQIEIAFNQAEKEVQDLRERTREGLREAKAAGKQIGGLPGVKRRSKRGEDLKEKIRKHSRAFGGSMTDSEFIEAYKCGKSTFIKYKREIREEA